MKLRFKISLITAVIIMTAIAVSGSLLWLSQKKELYNSFKNDSFSDTESIVFNLNRSLSGENNRISREKYNYFFKSLNNDYCIFYFDGDEIHNNTIISHDELKALKYSTTSFGSLSYSYIKTNGKKFLCTRLFFGGTQNELSAEMYVLYDTYNTDKRLNLFAMAIVLVMLTVSVFSFAVLYILMKRILAPLSDLSESAKAISGGAYEKRVSVSGNDEISMLANDFNLMADAVQSQISEMKRAEENKNAFMADFSHELKTPLTSISGYAQTMRTIKLSDDDKADALEYIYSESRRLDRLSKKMLRLFELDNDSDIKSESISVKALLESAVKTSKPFADKMNVTVEISADKEMIIGDYELLHDALSNLIDNAVKASNEGDTVKVYTENSTIVVSDNGCGIPQDEIDRITEPFYMVDKSRTRKHGGCGLGLSLVKKIMDKTGIRIEIQSNINKGTNVILHFDDVSMNT